MFFSMFLGAEILYKSVCLYVRVSVCLYVTNFGRNYFQIGFILEKNYTIGNIVTSFMIDIFCLSF